ncbi:pilus assembly protein CpaE [Sphingomonas sp. RB56-2]|uniref:Pilus assembly protein CpaE n=1 Tax=Sphingomonas brevis TaxID=2908206 RepID=A0ABT0SAL3_9SPHN|nr:pilus assembly protein CpaE [Sphingomonas brevis]MCL6741408.1 pilus assembly protein CpaE [Sphingomonas brevis]
MSVHNPDRPTAQWMADTGPPPVRLLLAGAEGQANELVGARAAGFPLELVIIDTAAPIDPSVLSGAAAAVVQVTEGDDRSTDRFKKLAEGPVPLIAAAYEPSMKLVRALVRAGAHDVVPLPLDPEELETALDPIRRIAAAQGPRARAGHQKIVTVIKSEGGIGATALLSQLALRFAANEAAAGREACLIDLDVQFGNAALQLGLQPSLTFSDLVEAGKRLDGDLLRSVATRHPSGLRVIGAPREIMPLEMLTSEQMLSIVDLAVSEYGTVLVDLPMNWTNWSLSLLARSDLVLLVTELRVPSLHRARRQLDLLGTQDMGNLEVRIVLNRTEKGFFRTLSESDAERVLKKPVSYCISNDHETMSQAIDRGIPIDQVKRKSPLCRDIDALERGLAGALGLER